MLKTFAQRCCAPLASVIPTGFQRSVLLSPFIRTQVQYNRGEGFEDYDHTSYSQVPIDGEGKVAVIFGGFGFTQRQMSKHEAIYHEHGFETQAYFHSITQMTSPKFGVQRGIELAEDLRKIKKPLLLHIVSGSVWLSLYAMHNLGKEFCEKNIRAIAFDSSPPKPCVEAFGGYVSFATKKPWLKKLTAPLFHPFLIYQGVDAAYQKLNATWMFDHEQCVIPRNAHICLMHGRNDPVLDREYVQEFAACLRKRSTATVTEFLFPKARHSMAIVDYPEQYKTGHIQHLLASVRHWNP